MATTHGRRTEILQAAHEAVSARGFAAASIKEIAARAGVSAGTVYTYFGSRDQLLAQVFREAAAVEFEAVAAAVGRESGVSKEIRALVETFAHRAFANRIFAWALLIEPAGAAIDAERLTFRRKYADLTERIITRAIEAGQAPEQDPRIVGPGLIGLISEALTGPLSPEGSVPTEHLVEGVIHMCQRAIGEVQ